MNFVKNTSSEILIALRPMLISLMLICFQASRKQSLQVRSTLLFLFIRRHMAMLSAKNEKKQANGEIILCYRL